MKEEAVKQLEELLREHYDDIDDIVKFVMEVREHKQRDLIKKLNQVKLEMEGLALVLISDYNRNKKHPEWITISLKGFVRKIKETHESMLSFCWKDIFKSLGIDK
jgi:hypothetical protein